MSEKLIKSKKRVQKHGEVFTPSWMVEKMLNSEGIKEACENLNITFLEPSAGEGNFLVAILKRKLEMVSNEYNNSLKQFENFSLFALLTLYGIELLPDNTNINPSALSKRLKGSGIKVYLRGRNTITDAVHQLLKEEE